MKNLENILRKTAGVLILASAVYASGCGSPYWTKDIMKSLKYPSNCNNPKCPGHSYSQDRCPKSFSDRIYFWK